MNCRIDLVLGTKRDWERSNLGLGLWPMDRTWTPWSPSGRGPWQDINLLWKTRPSSIDIIIHHSSYKGDHFCQPKMARARLEKPDILWSIHISILVCVCICSWHFSRFALVFPACHLRFLRACHLSQSCVGAACFSYKAACGEDSDTSGGHR